MDKTNLRETHVLVNEAQYSFFLHFVLKCNNSNILECVGFYLLT